MGQNAQVVNPHVIYILEIRTTEDWTVLAPNECATSVKVGAIVAIYTVALPQITHDPELWALLLVPLR